MDETMVPTRTHGKTMWRAAGRSAVARRALLFGLALFAAAAPAAAEPIYARELVYKAFVPREQGKVVVVALGLYGSIPEEVERDLAGQREHQDLLGRVLERAYPSFYRAGWQARRPRTEGRQELVHERVRVEVDRRRKGEVITYYNTVCDPDDLFNQKKYRAGLESFAEYWDGLAAEVERCLLERLGVR